MLLLIAEWTFKITVFGSGQPAAAIPIVAAFAKQMLDGIFVVEVSTVFIAIVEREVVFCFGNSS